MQQKNQDVHFAYLLFLSLVAGLGGFLFGYDTAVVSGTNQQVALRFGLDDGRARTLEEVGKEFNVTRERIRQIEAKALRKLRHPSRSRKLRDYFDYLD